jgi:Tol biopolymer transport system component
MVRRSAEGLMAIVAALLLSAAAAQSQDKAEAGLKAAMDKEVVDGNLKAAIEQYKTLAQGQNKSVAARALLRLGECYEKQGNADARKTYEQILSRFGDQKQVVEQARTRLSRLGEDRRAGEQANRVVWAGPKVYPKGSSVSPDGRYIAYPDWDTGNLGLHDLVSSSDRRLTDTGHYRRRSTGYENGNSYAYAEAAVISKDGKQVVYSWDDSRNDAKGGGYELRLANLTGDPLPRNLYLDPGGRWVSPEDWSYDGRWIAVQIADRSTAQIGVIATQDGSLRVLKSGELRGGVSAPKAIRFSPDGRYLGYDRLVDDSGLRHGVFVSAVDGSGEIAVAVDPCENETVGWSPDGKYLLYTSDRTGSTDLWAAPFANGTPQGRSELVKSNIGRIVSLGLSASGALYYGVLWPEVLSHIQMAAFNFDTGRIVSAPVDLAPDRVLESNTSPDWSSDGKRLAYLSRSATGMRSLAIKIRSAETGQIRELRDKAYGATGLRWSPDGRFLAITEHNYEILKVDAETGETRVLVSKLGLMGSIPAWSPDGNKIYYRVRGTADLAIIEHDLVSGNDRELIRRPVLGDVNLSPNGKYIAAASTDPSTNFKTILRIPVGGGDAVEAMKAGVKSQDLGVLTWAPDSRSILIRRSDSERKQPSEVWLAPLDGRENRKLYDLDARVGPGPIRLHPDGRQIAFAPAQESAATRTAEVWVLENFLPAAQRGAAAN